MFELKAEYEWREILLWHVVPAGTSTAVCGRFLAPAAQTRPITDLTALRGEVCVRCTSTLGLADPSEPPRSSRGRMLERRRVFPRQPQVNER